MGNTGEGGLGVTTEAPREADEAYQRSLGWYATVVGITTGIFGVLAGIGLTLLPANTLGEKSLIIGACIALAIAGYTGVGAWQSKRRFAATAVAVALAIVGLAALSITANTDATISQPPSGPASASLPAEQPSEASTGSSGSTAPAIPQASTLARAVYVSENITGTPGPGDPGPDNGAFYLGRTKYTSSLGYEQLCSLDASGPLTVTYPLSDAYRYLTAELGIADAYARAGHNEQVTFEVDKYTASSGSPEEIKRVTVRYGPPVPVRVNIQGAVSLVLSTAGSDCIPGSVAVWGSVQLVPLSDSSECFGRRESCAQLGGCSAMTPRPSGTSSTSMS